MKRMFTLLALGASLALGAAQAAEEKAATAAPNRMKTCNANAEGKKGDERKAFMKECLSNKADAATPAAAAASEGTKAMTPQSRMKTCNANAKGKKGEERKAYMKECLSTS